MAFKRFVRGKLKGIVFLEILVSLLPRGRFAPFDVDRNRRREREGTRKASYKDKMDIQVKSFIGCWSLNL